MSKNLSPDLKSQVTLVVAEGSGPMNPSGQLCPTKNLRLFGQACNQRQQLPPSATIWETRQSSTLSLILVYWPHYVRT